MKTVLALAAALGLSITAASACPYKKDVTASVDTTMTVASIASEPVSTPADAPAESAVDQVEQN